MEKLQPLPICKCIPALLISLRKRVLLFVNVLLIFSVVLDKDAVTGLQTPGVVSQYVPDSVYGTASHKAAIFKSRLFLNPEDNI
jgi:hypothetical protein